MAAELIEALCRVVTRADQPQALMLLAHLASTQPQLETLPPPVLEVRPAAYTPPPPLLAFLDPEGARLCAHP